MALSACGLIGTLFQFCVGKRSFTAELISNEYRSRTRQFWRLVLILYIMYEFEDKDRAGTAWFVIVQQTFFMQNNVIYGSM